MATVTLTPNPVSTGTFLTVIADDLSWEATGASVRSVLLGDADRDHEMDLHQEWDRRRGNARLLVPLAITPGEHRVEVTQRWRDGARETYEAFATAVPGEFGASFAIQLAGWVAGGPEFDWEWSSNDRLASGRRWVHGWQPGMISAGSGRARSRLQVAYGIENGKVLTAYIELTSSTGVTRRLEHQVTCPPRPATEVSTVEVVEAVPVAV